MNSLFPRLLLKYALPSNNLKFRDGILIFSDINHVVFFLKCPASLRSFPQFKSFILIILFYFSDHFE